jgi:hypothetical protein
MDITGIDPDVLELTQVDSPECRTDSPTKVSCPVDALSAGGHLFVFGPIGAASPKKQGPAGSLTVSVSSDATDADVTDNTTTVEIEAVPAGYDLVAWVPGDDFGGNLTVAPGATADVDWLLVNAGSKTVAGVRFGMALPRWATFADKLPGCTYSADNTQVTCVAPDTVVAPDDVFGFEEPMRVKVAREAPGPITLTGYFGGYGLDDADPLAIPDKSVRATVRRATAAQLEQIESDPSDNIAEFDLQVGRNTADVYVTAATVRAKVGQTVALPFTIGNHGPATGSATFTVTAPEGAVIVASDDDASDWCYSAARGAGKPWTEAAKVSCAVEDELRPGTEMDLSLTMRVDRLGGKKGSITVAYDGFASTDARSANNTVAIVVAAPVAYDNAPVTPDDDADTLPDTGWRGGSVAAVGAATLLFGVVLMMTSRSRRTRRV